MIRTILLTGPIGSGKSEVRKYLESLGYPVYDSDSRCKALYETVPGLKARIEQELGIPFAQLKTVFEDSEKLKRLESIVYPLLLEDIRSWKASLEGERCFLESAIALEKPQFDGEYEEVWMVSAPLETRIQRNPAAALRDGLQHFDDPRISVRIDNDSTVDELKNKIDKII